MIAGTSFAATGPATPRPESPATQGNHRAQAEASTPATTQPADAPPREVAQTARAPRTPTTDAESTPDRGDDFASLLLPATQTPAVVATALPAATPAPVATETAATPDQWLSMLAGVLAMPVAVNAPEAAATPAAGIPSPAVPTPTATALALPLAMQAPAATAAGSPPLASLQPALGLAIATDAGAADPAVAAGAEAKPLFETTLNGLAAPTAPTGSLPVCEAAPPPPPLQMPAEPANGFDDGIGTHIAWMAGQRLGEARISVSPDHLGPIEVTLKLDDARVDAHFHSTHVEVRAALEASVPRLRELLAQHGLQLGQADVGERQQAGQPHTGRPDTGEDGAAGNPTQAPPIARRRGLLDEYA